MHMAPEAIITHCYIVKDDLHVQPVDVFLKYFDVFLGKGTQ